MNRIFLVAGGIVLSTAALAPFLRQPAVQSAAAANAVPGRASPWDKAASATPARGASAEMVEIERDGGGQFHLDVGAGGETVRFLVDTGADVVALTVDDADRLGIRPDPGDYRPMLRTASGTGMAAPVQIVRLTIGGRDLDDIDAVVVPELPVSLLGQSALRRLGSVTLRGDRLTITG